MSSFLGNFYNFNFFGPNLKNKTRGQFANFKKLRGQIIIFGKFEGSIVNFLEIYWGQIENLKKIEDQNAKIERL